MYIVFFVIPSDNLKAIEETEFAIDKNCHFQF